MSFASDILLSQYTFERLAPAVLTLVIFLFLMVRRGKDRAQLYLALYFLFAFLYEAGHIVTYSVYSPAGAIGWYMTALAPFGLVFLIQFAYCFSSSLLSREGKAVYYITLALSVFASGEYFIRASLSGIVFTETGYAPDFVSRSIPILCFFEYGWMIVVYVRNIVQGRFQNVISRILRPDTASGRISRNLAVLVLFDLIKTALILFHVFLASLPYVTVVSIQNILFLLVYSLYVIVFIRDDLPRLSLGFKVVGSIFVINLVVFSSMGQVAMTQFENSYDEKRLAELKYVIREVKISNLSDLPGDLDFAMKIGPDRNVFLYFRDPSQTQTGGMALSDFTPGRWSLSTDEQNISPEKAGLMKRYYARMSGHNYNVYLADIRGEKFCVGYNFRMYREAASRPAEALVLISILSTMFILFVLPLVLTRLLTRSDSFQLRSGGPEGDEHAARLSEVASLSFTLEDESEDREYVVTPEARLKVDRAIGLIAENYMHELTREGLAEIIGLSPGRFGRAFRTCTGKKVGEYVNDLRIEKAKELLQGHDAVINIAYSVGFESLSTFSRAFHKNCGMTPSAYRESLFKNRS